MTDSRQIALEALISRMKHAAINNSDWDTLTRGVCTLIAIIIGAFLAAIASDLDGEK